MAQEKIAMSKFRSSLSKISRLAKTGYKSITSVASQIISTVTSIASKIAVVRDTSYSLPGGANENTNYNKIYEEASAAEEKFLNQSLQNINAYKDEVIFDIYRVGDALSQNSEAIAYSLIKEVKKAFADVSDDFFACGNEVGTGFGAGLILSTEKAIEDAKSLMQSAMAEIAAMMDYRSYASYTNSSVTYSSPSYNFYGSGQTVSEQLNEARQSQIINELRGIKI